MLPVLRLDLFIYTERGDKCVNNILFITLKSRNELTVPHSAFKSVLFFKRFFPHRFRSLLMLHPLA